MKITDIEKAAALKNDLKNWQSSLYNLRRLLDANIHPKDRDKLSNADYNIWGKIKLWFESKSGKHEIQCGQPSMNGLSAGYSEKFVINTDQLAIFCDYIEIITKQKEAELLNLINDDICQE